MSPLYQVKDNQQYPPFLLMHGDADKTVPYHEMEDMYHELEKHHVAVEATGYEGPFMSATSGVSRFMTLPASSWIATLNRQKTHCLIRQ